jgi:hypothetical protein
VAPVYGALTPPYTGGCLLPRPAAAVNLHAQGRRQAPAVMICSPMRGAARRPSPGVARLDWAVASPW